MHVGVQVCGIAVSGRMMTFVTASVSGIFVLVFVSRFDGVESVTSVCVGSESISSTLFGMMGSFPTIIDVDSDFVGSTFLAILRFPDSKSQVFLSLDSNNVKEAVPSCGSTFAWLFFLALARIIAESSLKDTRNLQLCRLWPLFSIDFRGTSSFIAFILIGDVILSCIDFSVFSVAAVDGDETLLISCSICLPELNSIGKDSIIPAMETLKLPDD